MTTITLDVKALLEKQSEEKIFSIIRDAKDVLTDRARSIEVYEPTGRADLDEQHHANVKRLISILEKLQAV